jgi:phosphate transport system substrate-binding protein
MSDRTRLLARQARPFVFAVAAAVGLSTAFPASAQTLNGAGATFPQPLYKKWFYEFHKATGVRVNYQGIGSGGGIRAIQAGTVDFAGSDAPLTDAELKTVPAPVIQIPATGGAVAVSYNVNGVPSLRLSPATLAGIYLGQISKWNDPKLKAENPNAKLPAQSITVVHRSDGSGTTFLFTTYLAAVSPAWRSEAGAAKEVKWPRGVGGKGNPGVAGVVKQTPGAIGYVELAYAKENALAMAALKNSSGRYITPTVEATTACIQGALSRLTKDVRQPVVNPAGNDAYPIAGLTFILVYKDQKDAAKGKALVNLLQWAMKDGQKMGPPLGYAPLPPAVAEMSLNLVKSIHVP